jgi:hypothetical protein
MILLQHWSKNSEAAKRKKLKKSKNLRKENLKIFDFLPCINLFSFEMKRTFLYISNLISIKWLETLNQTNFEKNQIKAQRFRLI